MEQEQVGFGQTLLSGLFLGVALLIYFFPAINGRKHRQATPILLVNLFFGWTVIGWIAALIWSTSTPAPAPQMVAQPAKSSQPISVADEIAKLDKLWDAGKITNAQYLKLKEELINKGHA